MCGMGSADVTIGNEVTNDPKATPKAKAVARSQLAKQFGLDDPNPPPPAAPDLADQLLQKAGATSLMRQQSKQGRKSAFLTGAMGDVTTPLVSKKTALGGY